MKKCPCPPATRPRGRRAAAALTPTPATTTATTATTSRLIRRHERFIRNRVVKSSFFGTKFHFMKGNYMNFSVVECCSGEELGSISKGTSTTPLIRTKRWSGSQNILLRFRSDPDSGVEIGQVKTPMRLYCFPASRKNRLRAFIYVIWDWLAVPYSTFFGVL